MNFRNKKLIQYWLHAQYRKGHNIHSPFLFRLITTVIENDGFFSAYSSIEKAAQICLEKGTNMHNDLNEKFGKLIFRLVNEFRPEKIIYIGKSNGFNIACLALADSRIPVEVSQPEVVDGKLDDIVRKLKIKNITTTSSTTNHTGNFLMVDLKHADIALSQPDSLFWDSEEDRKVVLLTGIQESDETEKEWMRYKEDKRVKISLDLFELGICIIDPKFQKENFVLRF